MSLLRTYQNYSSVPETEILTVTGNEPVDDITVLSWLRESSDLALDEKININNLITECRSAIEQYLGFDIVQKTRRVEWETFATVIELPYGPHGAVSNVKRTFKNEETTLTTDDYYLSGLQFKKITINRVFSVSGAQSYRLTLDVVSGYAGDKLPKEIRLALQQMILNAYEYRGEHPESMQAIPGSVKELLKPLRRNAWL